MVSNGRRFLSMLGLAVLFFIAAGQVLHAVDGLFANHADCSQAADSTPTDCPSGHSCCHFPIQALVSPVVSVLPQVSRDEQGYSFSEQTAPSGSLREIDLPPQLS